MSMYAYGMPEGTSKFHVINTDSRRSLCILWYCTGDLLSIDADRKTLPAIQLDCAECVQRYNDLHSNGG